MSAKRNSSVPVEAPVESSDIGFTAPVEAPEIVSFNGKPVNPDLHLQQIPQRIKMIFGITASHYVPIDKLAAKRMEKLVKQACGNLLGLTPYKFGQDFDSIKFAKVASGRGDFSAGQIRPGIVCFSKNGRQISLRLETIRELLNGEDSKAFLWALLNFLDRGR